MAENKRDYSIDLLKAIAAILITNSHMESMYTSCGWLATGGAIGDSLFFFCSGYTLMLSNRGNGFLNWYKRRINRVFYTILAIGLILAIVNMSKSDNSSLSVLLDGGWFVNCIMIYYVAFYPIKQYLKNKLWHFVSVFLCLCIVLFYFTPMGGDGLTIYHETYFKWFHYFIPMIVGAICCRYSMQNKRKNTNCLSPLVILLASIVTFYAILYLSTNTGFRSLQLIDIVVLPIINVSLWMLCNSNIIGGLLTNKVFKACYQTIGGLCLEIYLIQSSIFTTELNHLFPLNLIIIFLAIVIAAYLVRCFSRFIAQTFKDGDYNFKEIIKAY